MTAIAIIASLVGYTVAIKVYAWFKAMHIDIDNMSEEEIKNMLDDLMQDPKFRKYMR